jgi:hypothetical protein
MVRFFRLMAALSLFLPAACGVRAAEVRPRTHPSSLADSGNRATPRTPIPVDHQTEAKALQLVQQHLPELNGVLKRLRADQSREYDRAIRDLAKSARKLETAKHRDERLYEIELELLKAQTEVNLLTAKLKVRDSRDHRKQLRVSAARLQQAQIARADYDVDLLRGRLERAKQQFEAASKRLEEKRTHPDQQLEKTYLGLLRRAGREPTK